jgi:hypothetical protein
MKLKHILFVIIFIASQQSVQSVVLAQEAIGINFFDIAHTDAGAPTCWGGGKGYAWVGAPTTFLNCTGGTTGGDVPVNMSVGAGALVLTTTRPGGGGWCNVQFKLDGGHSVNFLRYGAEPFLYLRLKWGVIVPGAGLTITLYDGDEILNSYAQYNAQIGPYFAHDASVDLLDYVTPSTDWQDVYIPMSAFIADEPNIDLTKIKFIDLTATGSYSETNTLYIEKFKIIRDIANQYTDMVKVNQLGYLPNQRKLAIVSYEVGAVSPAPTYFQLKDALTGSVVYQANLQLKTVCSSIWNKSGDTVFYADFSSFTTPGRYVIYCPELGQTSLAFNIGNKSFDRALRDATRFFYYGRSGYEINEPYAEGHTRPSIYANNFVCWYDYYAGASGKMYNYDPCGLGIDVRDVLGGWFDAGDLHMDIHNNVTTMWFLLEMLEQQYNKFGPRVLNLPESDSQTNDLVLLIKYELDWFKKMQNTDGSVHFIVSSEFSVSHQDISDVSTGAACILAGTFAKAYTLFSAVPSMQSYAQDLLSRAELSWAWLMAHTSNYNPTGYNGSTWSYGITSDSSFRQFAAIELYIATGTSTYRTYFESRYSSANTDMQGITAIGKGHMDYAETTRPVTTSIRRAIRTKYISFADTLVANVDCNPYRIPVKTSSGDLGWGSSGLIACNAYTLLRVYEWTGNVTYRNAALDALEWIGGRNPVSRIFITGDYSDYLHGTDIYSFFWFDHINPVPGYLCGNINTQDFLYLYNKYKYKYYLNIQNASTLEPCLPWQAELCYLLGYFAYDLKLPEVIDASYLLEFSNAWLTTPADAGWNPNCDIALPADHIINFLDFANLANKWMNQ